MQTIQNYRVQQTSNNTNFLRISNKLYKKLDIDKLKYKFQIDDLSEIEEIEAENCQLEQLTTLDQFVNLKKINLNMNHLMVFKKWSSNLQEISIQHNDFTHMDIFSNYLYNLRKLDLSNNQISVKDSDCFKFIPGLTHLNLSNNRIHSQKLITFTVLKDLQELNLMKNDLIDIAHFKYFKNKNQALTYFNISKNPICDVRNPKCVDHKIINNTMKKLLVSLKTLVLSENDNQIKPHSYLNRSKSTIERSQRPTSLTKSQNNHQYQNIPQKVDYQLKRCQIQEQQTPGFIRTKGAKFDNDFFMQTNEEDQESENSQQWPEQSFLQQKSVLDQSQNFDDNSMKQYSINILKENQNKNNRISPKCRYSHPNSPKKQPDYSLNTNFPSTKERENFKTLAEKEYEKNIKNKLNEQFCQIILEQILKIKKEKRQDFKQNIVDLYNVKKSESKILLDTMIAIANASKSQNTNNDQQNDQKNEFQQQQAQQQFIQDMVIKPEDQEQSQLYSFNHEENLLASIKSSNFETPSKKQ